MSTDKPDTMLMAVVNQFVEDAVSANGDGTIRPLKKMDTRVGALQLAMSSLEQTRTSIKSTTLQLMKERNALTPIQKLPFELMTGIFASILNRFVGSIGDERPDEEYIRCRLSLLLVCSRWTTILREDPAHWSYISAGFPPKIITQSLHLSLRRPLRILIPWDCPELKGPRKEVAQHASRWKFVRIIFETERGYKGVFPIPSAPILETLHILGEENRTPNRAVSISVGILPQLRNLWIRDLPVVLDASTLPSLRTLNLFSIEVEKMPVAMLLDFLAQTPGLEELTLEARQLQERDPNADVNVEPPRSFRSVVMPHLSDFSLAFTPPLYTQIMMSSIVFEVNMSFKLFYSKGRPSPNMKHFVVRQIHNWLTACRRNISCTVCDHESWNLIEFEAKMEEKAVIHITIHIHKMRKIEDVLQTASSFLTIARDPTVVAVHLHDGPNLSMVRRALYEPIVLKNVQKLVLPFDRRPWHAIASHDISSLLRELGSPSANDAGASTSDWLFQNLEELEIISKVSAETYATELLAMLKSRYLDHGHAEEGRQRPRPLKRLHIKGIDITTADKVEEILGSGVLTRMD